MTCCKFNPFIIMCVCVSQAKLYDLEGQVRRGAAEREMKKSEFQEVQKQKEQIESLYKRQNEARDTCSQDKVNTKTVQSLNDSGQSQ